MITALDAANQTERRLFLVAAILFPLLVFVGFARTYYLKSFFSSAQLLTVLVHIHGILMTVWVCVFAAQVWLISSARIRIHQRLGYAAIGLAFLIVIVGFFVATHAGKFGSSSTPPGIPPLRFMIVPMTDLFNFAVLFGAAICLRKQTAAHKRLMLLTAINFLPPAIARIPVASLQSLGPLWFFGFPSMLAIGAVGLDSWHNRKVNKIFVAGAVFLILSFVARLALMGTEVWLRFAEWLTSWAA